MAMSLKIFAIWCSYKEFAHIKEGCCRRSNPLDRMFARVTSDVHPARILWFYRTDSMHLLKKDSQVSTRIRMGIFTSGTV